jgi:NAD(P)-dependent dehydrogenase (short-subunit alcohol dehydrogenase family)
MKSVIITGANRGIGLGTAVAFANAGYQVFATMRNPDKAVELKKKIATESLNIVISAMDVDSDESVDRAMDTILELNGPVDVLVNNAGIERHGSVEEMELADFKSVMETNYFGVLRCTKKVLPSMRIRRHGCIINLSSVAGRIASSPLSSYMASKFALEAICESLAGEVKPYNIHVAIVEPGIISTDMARSITHGRNSLYPQVNRFGGIFEESLKTPRPATMVADKILEIAESGTWILRHPVGPDAQPFIDWRASMTDEQWVDHNASTDEEWYAATERDFGMDLRKVNS